MRGKFCLSVNYFVACRSVFWEMEDYGVVGSWTKKLDIRFTTVSSSFHLRWNSLMVIRPLYFYDNGDILIRRPYGNGERRSREEDFVKMLVYKRNEGKLWRKYFTNRGGSRIFGSFLYVETLVSPAMYLEIKEA